MKKTMILIMTLLSMLLVTGSSVAKSPQDPYANACDKPPASYNGPTFKLSTDYPTTAIAPPTNPPWITALDGKPISYDNAIAYVNALKSYIEDDMRILLFDYPNWDAGEREWYNQPWLSEIRDPIYGTYVGSPFPPNMFPLSNLKESMYTNVLVYYNDIAGYTLHEIWGDDAMNPDVTKAQYNEGAIIIKVALTTATPDTWSVLEGSQEIIVYGPCPDQISIPQKKQKNYLFQFDIIVKDTKTAPDTGWVFSTLVYDRSVSGDVWERMVPLGAMWGNDPGINSAVFPNSSLTQNVINPLAPLYSTETLGYGGRLSGPNDGAVQQDVIINGRLVQRVANSSCMSCHGTAQWPMQAFLLPGPTTGLNPQKDIAKPMIEDQDLVQYQPGTPDFNQWFQSRPGDVPQTKGSVALDYGMNLTFKALPAWYSATQLFRPEEAHREMLSIVPPALHQKLLNWKSTSSNGLPLTFHP